MSAILTDYNEEFPKGKSSKIIGIQFSILSPDEIRKSSVAEIKTRDTYINNKPVIGGLFDPRMGVLEQGIMCPTDQLQHLHTPGYFGHIELEQPVFYVKYLLTVIKILNCICFKCSKLKINKETYKHTLQMKPYNRFLYLHTIACKVKKCGSEIEYGCGCEQPTKIKKTDLATLTAEWTTRGNNNSTEPAQPVSILLTPKIVQTILSRMSTEDIEFLGFSPTFSRPEWMICEVLAVPPPAVRPSIKMDGQQRNEDDISHMLVDIVKTNKDLRDRTALLNKDIESGASDDTIANHRRHISEHHKLLQYYIYVMVDNTKTHGISQAAQRSGRPLKSIKERLNGKMGRVRGNLMGKRVDFSARSVITPDPNLSIRELGVPLKVAMNITKPVTVNKHNKEFLARLVANGPTNYPGAKILEKKNTGSKFFLQFFSKDDANPSMVIEEGDIVHRHMMNGDAVLFNRQPTLHRMSMMCHIAVIMYRGDSFRMNVACTKPYNADFDGDEMNLHMPQDEESEIELRHLAAVPYQMVSPANNSSIIGIFQDSLLGAYLFTRQSEPKDKTEIPTSDVYFTKQEAMHLLMSFNKINTDIFKGKKADEKISSFELLTQILPPITVTHKTDDNQVTNIIAGKYEQGKMQDSIFKSGSNGILQRIYNYFGPLASADFIDNFQNIITEYMKLSAYSVGISDLIANKTTKDKIKLCIDQKKEEVKNILDEVHMGIFENKTGKSNQDALESKIENTLNAALKDTGTISKENLDQRNRFVIMVNAGSKGKNTNISQMLSCLGQQAIDGKRIPYGFENRTLPHFTKYDDTPKARGFVEKSFIEGLSPEDLFFHAMAGRVGLIDTAVKTSKTGYIQRRLIKGLEDLKVEYDMSVRNNKNKIVQFRYGDDGIDTVNVESQKIPLVEKSTEDIYAHYFLDLSNDDNPYTDNVKKDLKNMKIVNKIKTKCKYYIDMMLSSKEDIIKHVFKNFRESSVSLPVSFKHIINNIHGIQCKNLEEDKKDNLVDISPLEYFELLEGTMSRLKMIYYSPPTMLFEVMYYYYLSPQDILLVRKFTKASITLMLEIIEKMYKKSIVAPGEMVGMIAAQSIGEPTTQLTLNTFHNAGVASKTNVVSGVERIDEILALSDNPKSPSITLFVPTQWDTDKEYVQGLIPQLQHTQLKNVVSSVQICFDPKNSDANDKNFIKEFKAFEKIIREAASSKDSDNSQDNKGTDTDTETEEEEAEESKNKWVMRLVMDKEAMLDKDITMDDIHFSLRTFSTEKSVIYSDYNNDQLVFRLRFKKHDNIKGAVSGDPLDQTDEIYHLKNIQDKIMNNIILRGVQGISNVNLRKIQNYRKQDENDNSTNTSKDVWVLDTVGSNLVGILGLDYVDSTRTISNDIQEIYRVLGIEAARQVIYNELEEVFAQGSHINYHHLNLLCDRMTYSQKPISIFRYGINNDDVGPIMKATFEETPEMFFRAAKHAELDEMRGISANIMCGQQGYYGTNSFQVFTDLKSIEKSNCDKITIEQNSIRFQQKINDINDINEGVCNIQISNPADDVEIGISDVGVGCINSDDVPENLL
jgi:DNA-directed RNA polymerase II subunit RPB1